MSDDTNEQVAPTATTARLRSLLTTAKRRVGYAKAIRKLFSGTNDQHQHADTHECGITKAIELAQREADTLGVYACAIEDIHAALSGEAWNADTLDAVADALQNAGLTIEEPGAPREPEEEPDDYVAPCPKCSGGAGWYPVKSKDSEPRFQFYCTRCGYRGGVCISTHEAREDWNNEAREDEEAQP